VSNPAGKTAFKALWAVGFPSHHNETLIDLLVHLFIRVDV